MWFGKIDEFACQRSKVTPNNIKNLTAEKRIVEFFLIFHKNFLPYLVLGDSGGHNVPGVGRPARDYFML